MNRISLTASVLYVKVLALRRIGREAEGTPLLRVHRGKTSIEGSNPSFSAIFNAFSLEKNPSVYLNHLNFFKLAEKFNNLPHAAHNQISFKTNLILNSTSDI